MPVGKVFQVEGIKRLPGTRLQNIINASAKHHLVGDAPRIQLIVGVLHHEIAQVPPLPR